MSYLLLYLGSLRQRKTIKMIIMCLLCIYVLFNSAQTNLMFDLINISFILVIQIFLGLFKNHNELICLSSIFIYSIGIDVVCYYMFPDFVFGQSLIQYVYNGILFNFSGLLIQIIVCTLISFSLILRRKEYEGKITCTRQ